MKCTGVAATYCPNHGDCTCPRIRPESEDPGDHERTMTDPLCPLHSPTSKHAE